MMKKIFRCLLVIVAFSAVFSASLAFSQETIDLTVLHLNDFHGHLPPFMEKSVNEMSPVGGAGTLAALIKKERSRNPEGTLLLAAGDMFQGTPISNVFRGQPVIELMNALQFDAMALGNHEFDWGQETLKDMMSKADFPFLSANIQDLQGKYPGTPKPFILLQRKGLTLAVIGVTTDETPYSTKPANAEGLRFSAPEAVLPTVIDEARGKGANLVILLSHLGLDADRQLAQRVSGIDVIVGGHSHTIVQKPLRVGETLIVQAGYYGLYLGVLNLKVDPDTRKIVRYTDTDELAPVLPGGQVPEDPEIAALVESYQQRVQGEFSRVVGETTVDLLRDLQKESNLGDLLCDAMRETSGAQIAFQNGGGIRGDLPAGTITLDQIYTLLPFDNVLVCMDLKGSEVLQALEKSGALETKMLQVSGLQVVYDRSKPAGSRVGRLLVGTAPLQPEATYRVVVNDFLAAGGDQFLTFKEGKNILYGDALKDVFIDYLGRHSPVGPPVQDRIQFVP